MPRDVTVIFENGAPEIYRGVPDDVRPEDVIRRARQENPDRAVKMLDGGKGADIRRGFIDRASGMGTDDLSIARTKNDDFGGYLRDQASQPKPGETPDETFKRQYGGLPMPERPGAVEGVARAGLQGGTVGAGDEIVASGKALLDTILRGDPYSDAYRVRKAQETARLNQFRQDSPIAAYGAEIAGAIPTSIMASPGAVGGSVLTRMLVNAGVGGAQGGVYGFNAGEGGVADRGISAIPGMVGGAFFGGAAVPAASGVRNLYQSLRTSGPAGALNMARPDYRVLAEILEADEAFTPTRPGGIPQGQLNIRQAGPNAMLADAGPNTMQALDYIGQAGGPGARVARTNVDARVRAEGTGVTQAMDRALGVPQGLEQVDEALRAGSRNPNRLAYDAAYERPIDYSSDQGRRLLDIYQGRLGQNELRYANELMRRNGEQSAQILFNVADDGSVTFQQLPDVRQWDYITRAMNAVAQQTDTAGAMGGQTPMGGAISNTSREIRGIIRDLVPEYGQALDQAADSISAHNALRLGNDILSPAMTRSELTVALRGMSQAERQWVAQGVRERIDDTIANVKTAMSDPNVDIRETRKVLADLSSRANREKITSIIGPEAAMRLFGRLDTASRAFQLRAGLAQNSKTAPRLMMEERIKGAIDGGPLNALRSGSGIKSAKEAVGTLLGRSQADRQRISDDVLLSIARALTEGDPQATLRLLSANPGIAANSQQLGRWAEMLLRRNAPVTAPAANEVTTRMR